MISSRHPSMIFIFIIFFISSHSYIINSRRSGSHMFSTNKDLQEISDMLSSRVAQAYTVFKGVFIAYNDNFLTGSTVAKFELKMFYKRRLKYNNYDGIWVADLNFQDTYHCFKQLEEGKEYLVFLNGSHFNISQQNILSTFYWISSNPIRASPKSINETIKYSCSQCSSPPEIKMTWRRLEERDVLRLECSSVSHCSLPVVTFWFKNYVLIKGEERSLAKYQIFGQLQNEYQDDKDHKYIIYKDHTSSILEISSISPDDHASYRCLMVSVTSQQQKELVWPPLPKTSPPPTTARPTRPRVTYLYVPCDGEFCSYNGLCFRDSVTDEKLCKCKDGFKGEFCQYLSESVRERPMESGLNNVYMLLAGICIVLVFILITVFCIVRAFEKLKKRLVMVSAFHESPPHSDTYAGDDKIIQNNNNNEYVDNQLMTSSQHPILLKPQRTPPTDRSIRKVFTHYFFGPQKSPTFHTTPPNTNPLPTKSISSPTQLTTKHQDDIELVNIPPS